MNGLILSQPMIIGIGIISEFRRLIEDVKAIDGYWRFRFFTCHRISCGPNWNFFGPYEYWDLAKIEPLVNVDLSELLWIKLLGVGLPSHWLLRESLGIVLLAVYFFVLPVVLLKRRYFRGLVEKMGMTRYMVGMSLFLTMMLLPIKMYCRWLFNLKYFVHIQEFFLNV